MCMKLISTLLALSLTAGLTSSALADRDFRRGGPGPQGDPVERVMNRFDQNRDGVLDRSEVAQMRQANLQKRQAKHQERRQRLFSRALQRFDKDRDGRLGPQEVPQKLAQKLTRFDLNGDGWVDANEIAQQPLRGRHARQAPQPQPQPYAQPPRSY